MKIAFLGKGGSGKSTLSTALVTFLHQQGWRVLAIDADYNMDLSYSLGTEPEVFLGSDPEAIKEYVGVSRNENYKQALASAIQKDINFYIEPVDDFTASISTTLDTSLRLITAGPHTDKVRSGDACSHSLAAPLKVYLPRLKISDREAVVIDERAGTDPVATGLLQFVDLAVVVREPTINSERVAEQIISELQLANIPYLLVDNKVHGLNKDKEIAIKEICKFLEVRE